MDRTARITISIPGNNRHVAPDVILADLARKLRGVLLVAGVHEVLIFSDGSVVLDMNRKRQRLPSHKRDG